MPVSPGVKRLEILHPSLESINRDSGLIKVEESTIDDHCLSVGVINCTGIAIINTNTIISIIHAYLVSYLSGKPGSWLPSGLTRVVDLVLEVPPMRNVPMSGSGVQER